MRTFQLPAVLSAAALLAACGDNGASQSSTPNTQVPIVQKIASPVTEGLNKATEDANKVLGTANEKVEAAKAEVAKYQKQVDDLVAEKGGLEAKKAEAQAALDKINADAKEKVAPLQAQLDKVNEQIKQLQALPGLGAAPASAPVRAGFDLGGLAGKSSDKLNELKTTAAKYQAQIDSILDQAKTAGLPYTEQIASYTGKLKSVTESLTSAQGLLETAKQNLASLTASQAK